MALSAPVLLTRRHDTGSFDCGKAPLNQYLQQYALGNQAGGAARTYVVLRDGVVDDAVVNESQVVDESQRVDESVRSQVVVGYYSLAPAAVTLQEAPGGVRKGQAQHPVPCILLARLAVDKGYHGKGLGASLFRDALLRALAAHEQIGGRAFLVHAMDDEARRFYARYDMLPSPTDPLHLYLLFKDIRALLA